MPFWTAYAGVYKESGQINGKRSFTSIDNVTAIWYNPPARDWLFGSVEYIGQNLGLIHSDYNDVKTVCPQEIPFDKWKWYSNETWFRSNQSEIQLQCGKKSTNSMKCNTVDTRYSEPRYNEDSRYSEFFWGDLY